MKLATLVSVMETQEPQSVCLQTNECWHAMEADDVLAAFNSSQDGLTSAEAQARLERYGPNTLELEKGFRPLDVLVRLNADPIVYVLIAAGVVTVLLGDYIDAGVIFAVVVINTIIGYVQEFKAEQSLQALRKLTAPRARVFRDGEQRDIQSSDVVPGDIVYIESGAKLPADLRLFRTIDLYIDEAILTGESQPEEKITGPVPDPNTPLGDRTTWPS